MHYDKAAEDISRPDCLGFRDPHPCMLHKFLRALRWAGAFILIGAGFWVALILTALVYTHIFGQGAQACENWYEDQSEWSQLPEAAI